MKIVSKNLPLVSVVICTKNEAENIGRCLKDIKYQTYSQDKIELMVVDNNSTDRTQKIAKKYTNKVFNPPDLSDLTKVKNFRGAQVNFGVKMSKGEIIFFPDADMTFDEGLLREIALKSKQFDALYIPEVIVGRGFFGRIRNFERSFYNGTPVDAVRVVKRNLFIKIGGYDEENIIFGADDWDLTKRVRKATQKISITNNKLYHHEESVDWKTFLSKKQKYVKCFNGYIKKWGEEDPDIKRQLGLWYRAVVVFVEDGKWKKLILNPILALGMYFLRFLTWLSYKVDL